MNTCRPQTPTVVSVVRAEGHGWPLDRVMNLFRARGLHNPCASLSGLTPEVCDLELASAPKGGGPVGYRNTVCVVVQGKCQGFLFSDYVSTAAKISL